MNRKDPAYQAGVLERRERRRTQCPHGHGIKTARQPDGGMKCAECKRLRAAKERAPLRNTILDALGAVCACSCGCSERERGMLSIDHIHNDGAAHRKAVGPSPIQYWAAIIREGIPRDRYRILCYSCNLGRQFHGGPEHVCPRILSRRVNAEPHA